MTLRFLRTMLLAGAVALAAVPSRGDEISAEQAIGLAEIQLRGARTEARTKHFVVVTNSPDTESAGRVARNLEAAYKVTLDLLGNVVTPHPAPPLVSVYVYRSHTSLDLLGARLHISPKADGFYNGSGLMAFSFDAPVVEVIVQTMIHETVHVVLHHVAGENVARIPRWLNEGFAEYIACSEMRDGELRPGMYVEFMEYRNRYGVVHERSKAGRHAELVRKSVKSKTLIPTAQILSAEPAEFYGENRKLYYAESWLLVHYLNYGRQSWDESRFASLIGSVLGGISSTQALHDIYGLDPAKLDGLLAAYAKTF